MTEQPQRSEPAGSKRTIPAWMEKVRLRTVLLIAFGACLVILALTGRTEKKPPVQTQAPYPVRLKSEEPVETRQEPAAAESYTRPVVRPDPVQMPSLESFSDESSQKPGLGQPEGAPAARHREGKKILPEIFRMPGIASAAAPAPQDSAPAHPAPPSLRADFAPFGRMIKCELVNTLDSVTQRAEPIVALVVEDLDWNGHVIIAAGTEAFGYAKPEAIVDANGGGRLVDTGEWRLVLPAYEGRENGRELELKARAIDRRESLLASDGKARSWELGDGTPGLVGYTLSTLDNEQIKLFAAAAISGIAQGISTVVQRQQAAAGLPGLLGATQPAPTVDNAVSAALGQGTIDVVNQVADRIRQEISRRGVYVRIPAGKPFYLFVEQTIDPRLAAVDDPRDQASETSKKQ